MDKYRHIIYRCNGKYKNHCNTKIVSEEEIKDIFVKEFNELFKNKKEVIENLKNTVLMLSKYENLTEKYEKLIKHKKDLERKSNELISRNSSLAADQTLYSAEYNKVVDEYNKVSNDLLKIDTQIKEKEEKTFIINKFISDLEIIKKPLKEFNDTIFCSLVDNVLVGKDDIKIKWRTNSGS